MVKKIVKKASKIVLLLLLIITLLIGSGILAGYIYKDEIRNYIISEINKEIEVKVNISSVEWSVFRKFPFVSIVLNDAAVLSGKDFARSQFSSYSTDTLFSAKRIYLQFNLLDIINEDYRLRRVHAVNGKLNIAVDNQGKTNYRVFKGNDNDFQSNFTFGLDAVKITGFSLEYRNLAKKIIFAGKVNELSLKGKFSQDNFDLNTVSGIFIDTLKKEGFEYASGIKMVSRVVLNVKDSVYNINKGDLILNGLKFNVKGSFVNGSKTLLDLQVSGGNLNINSLLSILPQSQNILQKYSATGTTDILAKIKGEISSTAAPSIKAAFKVMNGKVFITGQDNPVSGISLKGTFSNGSRHNASTSKILLNEFAVNYGDNHLNGKITIVNFIKPFLSATISGSIIAKNLSERLKIDKLELEQGFLYPDLTLNVNMDSFSDLKIQNISFNEVKGTVGFKEIAGKIPYSSSRLELLEGKIIIDEGTFSPELSIKLGKSRFSMNLVINYLWEYIIDKSKIPEINGEVDAGYLLFQDFEFGSGLEKETDFQLPDSLFLNLHCKADSFVYGKFLASGLDTWFIYKPGLLSVSSLKMQTMKGKVSTSGTIIADNKGQIQLRASGDLRKIDIQKLFYTFNNFGQSFILAENLKGLVTGNVDFSAFIDPQLKLQTKNLSSQSDFIIEEGELINFEPITELSSFVELSELKHIKFSTLKNSVLIKDEKVYIPQMDINSSAFNLSVSGTHGFDNYFEYKLRLNLSEILAGKARKAKKENEEFGIIEEGSVGNTNIYLSITGTPDSFKIRYDKKEALNKIKNDLKEEKKLIKTILREELGIFRKDSINIVNKNSNAQKDQFIMDWDDEKNIQIEPDGNQKPNKIKKKDPDINITWDEEDPDL